MHSAIAVLTLVAQLWGGFGNRTPTPILPMVSGCWSSEAIPGSITVERSLVFVRRSPCRSTTGEPTVTQVYPVRADIVAVEIATGHVIYGQQRPYKPQRGDRIVDERTVKRHGEAIGTLVGQDQDILYTVDHYRGTTIAPSVLQDPQTYGLTSPTDGHFATARSPSNVFYKRKPTDLANTAHGKRWPMRHTVYLELPTPLVAGAIYTLTFKGVPLVSQTFTYDSSRQPSEAVHVSQIGFRPSDPAKVGFLSTWMGSGGALDYPEALPFSLIDTQTNKPIYQGQTELSAALETLEDPYRNYNGTDVYKMNFADVQTPGTYRLCVETVGCSRTFPIHGDVWYEPFVTSMKGLYHQRSGIAIGTPYSDYQRPRAFHPDDGVVVYQSTAKLMDTTMGKGDENAFEALTAGRTDTTVPEAWGGYFDAGDWDRRIQHLSVAQSLLELVELSPEAIAAIELSIPESDNALPDVVDEALWGIDFFQRLQHEDGGIPGGVESAQHPRYGEASWQESQIVMAYAPDIWSSYWYASAAAQAAIVVQRWDTQRAAAYEASALAAFAYAERQYPQAPPEGWHRSVRDYRNLAALTLWQLTDDDRWHQLFLETTPFTDPEQPVFKHQEHRQATAAFLYARLQHPAINRDVQANARRAILRQADTVVALTEQTGFQWAKHHPRAPVGYGIGWSSPDAAQHIIRAHYLQPDDRYLAAIIRSTQAALGANPENLVYTTGLGQRSPQHPLIIDQRLMGVTPPPGITVFGPLDLSREFYQDYWFTHYQMPEQMFPAPTEWPTMELHIDIHNNVAMSEFTVHQTIGPAAYVWGYLATLE